MSRRVSVLPQTEIEPDTPLRLADAVVIAFPMGGMTVAARGAGARGEAELKGKHNVQI